MGAVAGLVVEAEAFIAVRIAAFRAQLLPDLVVAENALHRHHLLALVRVRHHSRIARVFVVVAVVSICESEEW